MFSIVQRSAVAAVVTAATLAAFAPAESQAITFFSDRASWEGAMSSWTDIALPSEADYTDSGLSFTPVFGGTISFANNPGAIFLFDTFLGTFSVTPGELVFTGTDTLDPVTGTFTSTMAAFGFEIAPLSVDGTITLDVGGDIHTLPGVTGAPVFMGWTDGTTNSMTVTCDGCDFAIASMVVGEPLPPTTSVVEPATIALFGFGLAGLGYTRRRKTA